MGAMAEDPTVTLYAPYPQPDQGYVTDIANLLTAEQEEQLEGWLFALEQDNGIEMAVVTIGSIADYPGTGNGSVETFATGLFNKYGIGNLPKNDGVLLLVAVNDREARIELGDGYGSDRDRDAERIMQTVIVPQFRNGRFDRGILEGTRSILQKFGGKDVSPAPKALAVPSDVPAVEVRTSQHTASSPTTAVPSRNTAPRQNTQPVRYVQPSRSFSGRGLGGLLGGLLCLGMPILVLVAMVSLVIKGGRSALGSSGSSSVSVPSDSGIVHDGYNRGFWSGLLLGGYGSRFGHGASHNQGISFGGRASHNHGIGFGSGSSHKHGIGFGGGRSHGGFGGGFGGGSSGGGHRSSGFGGGLSRGCGATGKW
jgi:uncharacterized membrane protein YgcG